MWNSNFGHNNDIDQNPTQALVQCACNEMRSLCIFATWYEFNDTFLKITYTAVSYLKIGKSQEHILGREQKNGGFDARERSPAFGYALHV